MKVPPVDKRDNVAIIALIYHIARRGDIFGASSLNAALIIRPVTQSHGATILRWKAV